MPQPSRYPARFWPARWNRSERTPSMILGMTPSTFTLAHVLLSLVGIISGLIVMIGMLRSKELTNWTALFLATTVLTSVTGFLFHSSGFGPSHIVGLISL